jgi:phosphoadenosine phosphosulfate reductase
VHGQTTFLNWNKERIALERIKSLDPIAHGYMDTPYYVAYSGGKDSDVLRILFELSGVKYDLVHNHTTVDAPETVHYVRSIPGVIISKPEITMWDLIVKKRMPPTRIVRYCCTELKERGGQDRFVATGVRWAESVGRKAKRNSLEIISPRMKDKIVLNADNDESRRMFETCSLQGKRVLNPIIDWTDDDVWEFLRYYGCRSNPLYGCGFKRIGCIGCPMAQDHERLRVFGRYPQYRAIYIHAFNRMLAARRADGLPTDWQTEQQVFDWWVHSTRRRREVEDQIRLSEVAI